MKTSDFAGILNTFATLAESRSADELREFARFFSSKPDQTVAQRLKGRTVPQSHPSSLKKSLATIRGGLASAGIKKTVLEDFDRTLSLFQGPPSSDVPEFIQILSIAQPKSANTKVRKSEKPIADEALARRLADELTEKTFDAEAFEILFVRLSDPKQVSTPTLASVGNRFLANQKTYKGRAPVLADIKKRHKQDLQYHAGGSALRRVRA